MSVYRKLDFRICGSQAASRNRTESMPVYGGYHKVVMTRRGDNTEDANNGEVIHYCGRGCGR